MRGESKSDPRAAKTRRECARREEGQAGSWEGREAKVAGRVNPLNLLLCELSMQAMLLGETQWLMDGEREQQQARFRPSWPVEGGCLSPPLRYPASR